MPEMPDGKWMKAPEVIPDIGRRVQRKSDLKQEFVLTTVDGRPVWHWPGHGWPHGNYADTKDIREWRYISDTNLYFKDEDWQEAIRTNPLKNCINFKDVSRTTDTLPVNKPDDIPFPHSWLELHLQLSTSDPEETDKCKALILEYADSVRDNLPVTGEVGICVTACNCKVCQNTKLANFETRKEILKARAKDLIEFDPKILQELFVNLGIGSDAYDTTLNWLKKIGE